MSAYLRKDMHESHIFRIEIVARVLCSSTIHTHIAPLSISIISITIYIYNTQTKQNYTLFIRASNLLLDTNPDRKLSRIYLWHTSFTHCDSCVAQHKIYVLRGHSIFHGSLLLENLHWSENETIFITNAWFHTA